MEELVKELKEINENDLKEALETLQEKIESTLSHNSLETEKDIKKFKIAIRNHLNSIYDIRNNIQKERIIELGEIIAKEYIK